MEARVGFAGLSKVPKLWFGKKGSTLPRTASTHQVGDEFPMSYLSCTVGKLGWEVVKARMDCWLQFSSGGTLSSHVDFQLSFHGACVGMR